MTNFPYHCEGILEEGGTCKRADQCARFNKLATRVSRICYSGFSFFIPRNPDERSSDLETEAVVD